MEGEALITRFRAGFSPGFTAVTREEDWKPGNGIDFGVHVLEPGLTIEETDPKETCWVLLDGKVELACPGVKAIASRRTLFDEAPAAFHVPGGCAVRLSALDRGAELAVVRVSNPRRFGPRLFAPDEITHEYRGARLAQGACVRDVRLIFDRERRPASNVVIGEVVNYPGRWSSYPPHHHPQPEIYHYRFTDPRGYGHAELGEAVVKVRSHDTLRIAGGLDHPQVAAPGYGMYYLWIVRHLEGAPYTGFEHTPDHTWILDPAQQGWEPGSEAR